MTVPSTASEVSYATNGVTVAFVIPFVFDTSADVFARLTDSSGNIAPFTAFSVSGGGGSMGTLTTTATLATGYTLTIFDNPERSQATDYVDNDAFPADAHERALDKQTRLSKRLYQLIQRCLRTGDGDPITDLTLGSVSNRKGKYLFFNAVTGAIEYAANVVTTTLSQSIIGQLLNPQTAGESSAGIVPVNYWYSAYNVLRYGTNTVPGTTNMTSAIQNAILACYAAGGGEVKVPAGRYAVSTTITGRPGVFLIGEGPNTYYNVGGTSIIPTAAFSGSQVYRCDAGDVSQVIMSGAGLAYIAIDMDNIAASDVEAVVFRSVSNSRSIVNVTVLNHDKGISFRIDKTAFAGGFPSDGLEFISCFTYSKTIDYPSIVPKLYIAFCNEAAFRGCKFQHRTNTVQSGSIAAEIGPNALGVTFDTCGFAGGMFCALIRNVDTEGPAEHIRFINNIFENYQYGIYIRGPLSTSNQTFFAKRIIVEPGNRFLSAALANPRNVYIDRALGCTVWLDEYIGGGTGTPLLAELTSNSIGNIVYAQPSQCTDAGTNNILVGRNGNSLQISNAFSAEGTFTFACAAGVTGLPTGTARYWRLGNNVTLYVPQLQGAPAGATVSFSGIPASLRPARQQIMSCLVADAGLNRCGYLRINTDGTALAFVNTAGAVSGTFTNAGLQGIEANSLSYNLL